MAKNEQRGRLEAPRSTEERLRRLFASAGFSFEDQEPHDRWRGRDHGQPFDIVVGQVQLGRPRFFGLIIKSAIDKNEVRTLTDRLLEMPPYHGWHLSECWIVSEQPIGEQISFPPIEPQIRLMTVREVERLIVQARSESKKHPRREKNTIGAAVLVNEREIQMTCGALLALVDDHIQALDNQHPNSKEAIAARDIEVEIYEDLRRHIRIISNFVQQFKKGQIDGVRISETIKEQERGLQDWWNKNHERICDLAFGVGLFTLSITLCSLAGVKGTAMAVIAGVLAGGKPLADALKGFGKKLFS